MGTIQVQVVAFWLSESDNSKIKSGLQEIQVQIPENSHIKDLIRILQEEFPGIKAGDVILILNNKLVQENERLHDGDRLGLFPPLMGG